MELPARGTVRASGMCFLRNASVWAPASARVRVEVSMSARSPERVCMVRTKSSMAASCSGEACTTRSGPSSTRVRSSSVMRQAISTMVWRAGSSPVISRSIQASMRGHATGRSRTGAEVSPCSVRRCCASPCTSSTPTCRCPATPVRATPGRTSVPARTPSWPERGGRAVVPTGVAVAIPPGYAGLVLPRSGLAVRHGVTCLNAPGLVDSGYRGELQVVLVNHDPSTTTRSAGATASPSWCWSGWSRRPSSWWPRTAWGSRSGAAAASGTPAHDGGAGSS